MKKCLVLSVILLCSLSTANLYASTLEVAKAHLVKNDYSESLSILKKLTDTEPKNIEALYFLALNYYLLKEYELTVKYGIQAYCKDHTLAKNVRKYAIEQKFGAEAKIGLIRKIRLAKQIRYELLQVLNKEPNNINAHHGLANYNLYAPFFLSGRTKRSIYHAEQVLAADKQRAYSIFNNIYKKKKNKEKRINNLRKWDSEYPEDWKATLAFSFYEQEQKNYRESFKYLSNWKKTHPKHLAVNYQIGRLASITGEHLVEGKNGLIYYLSKPADIDEVEHHHAHRRLALVYQHLGNIDAAKEHVSMGLKIEPKDKSLLTLQKKLNKK